MPWSRFLSIVAAGWLAGGLVLSGLVSSHGAAESGQDVTLRGKVVTLAAALDAAKLGLRVDAEPIARQVVLLGNDGTITPLLSDEASRALFLDERSAEPPRRASGQAVCRCSLPSGGHIQDRAGWPIPDAGVLLQHLHDQRPISSGLPVLPGTDGAADEAAVGREGQRSRQARAFWTCVFRFLHSSSLRDGKVIRNMPAPLNVNLLLGLVAIVAVASTLLSMVALGWVTRRNRGRRKMAAEGAHTPPVTVFKPLKGLDEELEENLRSFFRLDYPVYQLLFGVADENDPAIAVVRALMAEFPAQDARLVVGCPAFGLNPKVENLASMDRYRKHDVILISDSNVRVKPSYLRETACYLAEPGVGLVTNLFAGVGDTYSGATMENLQLNGFIAGGMALASVMRVTCVVGKSMMMPVKALEAIGGFARVRNLLAEDQVIGVLVRKAGYSIRLSHHVIDNVNRRRGFNWFLNRHSRWYKIRRRMAAAHVSCRTDGQPRGRGSGVGVLGRVGNRLGGARGAGGPGDGSRRDPDPLAVRSVPRAPAVAFQPDQGFSPLAPLVRRHGQLPGPVAGPPVPRRPAHPAP